MISKGRFLNSCRSVNSSPNWPALGTFGSFLPSRDPWMKTFFPQIALAIGVLTSSIGVRVRRVFGFVLAAVCTGEGSQILIRFGGGKPGKQGKHLDS